MPRPHPRGTRSSSRPARRSVGKPSQPAMPKRLSSVRETPDEMKRFYDGFKARMQQLGRAPEACKIFFLIKPIIGDTDEAAQQQADALYAQAPVEAGLASLSTLMQLDLARYPLDQPLPAG